MTVRFYIRGVRGYVSGLPETEWTQQLFHAKSWVTSEAAHSAARAWYLNNGERLIVEARDTAYAATCL